MLRTTELHTTKAILGKSFIVFLIYILKKPPYFMNLL